MISAEQQNGASRAGVLSAWIWTALLLSGCAAIYLPGLQNHIIFDDVRMLWERVIWVEYEDPFALKQRWLSYQSFIFLEALFGEGWWKQRLFNMVLHVGVAYSLFRFFRLLLLSAPLRLGLIEAGASEASVLASIRIGVLMYAFSPMAVYAVAYLVQRSMLMATLFVVLGLTAFLKGLLTRRAAWFALAVLCYVLAMLGKEHALFAPVAAFWLYVLVCQPRGRALAFPLALMVALATVGGWTLLAVYGDIVGTAFDEFSRAYVEQLSVLQPEVSGRIWLLSVINQMSLFFYHAFLWWLPVVSWMSIDLRPPFPLTPFALPHFLGAMTFVALTAVAVRFLFAGRGRTGLAAFCILVPLTLFMTELAVVWVQDPMVLYRSYLWAITLPGLVAILSCNWPVRRLLALGGIVLLAFSLLAAERVHSLATEYSVWDDAVKKNGLFPGDNAVGKERALLNRGRQKFFAGEDEQAQADFRAAIALGGALGAAHYNLALVLMVAEKFEAALDAFEAAERAGYANEPLLYLQRATAYWELGMPEKARADLMFVIESDFDEESKKSAHAKMKMIDFILLPPGGFGMPLGTGAAGVPGFFNPGSQ